MAVKSKAKSKSKVKAKAKVAVKTKIAAKSRTVAKAKAGKPVKSAKPVSIKLSSSTSVSTSGGSRRAPGSNSITPLVKRVVNTYVERRPVMPRSPRVHQFAYMKAPGMEHAFEVGDNVEVFCDHEKSKERIRGWVKGIVVQVDNKMVAVQFRSNVFLTDGWMVPDRILWYPLTSEHIRPMPGKKVAVKKEFIPDY
ncbi:MAG: hypothetical protein JNM55_12825 [Anaerolineales bacterium]|nr:hypothetical protein [Anaerolineales bacterium]